MYLRFHVIEGWWADDGEADEEHICLRIGERSEAVVIFLSGGIPQSQADGPAIHHYTSRVIVEAAAGSVSVAIEFPVRGRGGHVHSRDVLSGEGICRIGDQKTCLRGVNFISFLGWEWGEY